MFLRSESLVFLAQLDGLGRLCFANGSRLPRQSAKHFIVGTINQTQLLPCSSSSTLILSRTESHSQIAPPDQNWKGHGEQRHLAMLIMRYWASSSWKRNRAQSPAFSSRLSHHDPGCHPGRNTLIIPHSSTKCLPPRILLSI